MAKWPGELSMLRAMSPGGLPLSTFLTDATSNAGLAGACANTTAPMHKRTGAAQMNQRARDLGITPSHVEIARLCDITNMRSQQAQQLNGWGNFVLAMA